MASNGIKKKKKSNVMDSNGRLIKGARKRTNSTASTKNPRTPPKYAKNGSAGSASATYNSTKSSNGNTISPSIGSKTTSTTPKSSVLRFDQPVLCFHPNANININTNNMNTMNTTNNTNNMTINKPQPPMLTKNTTSTPHSLRNVLISHKTNKYYSNSTPSSPNALSASINNINLSTSVINNYPTINIQKHTIITQLKRKRKNNTNASNSSTSSSSTSSTNANGADSNASRPTFQFKIGMQVGVALGDCFLQLQKLENSMDKLRNVSEDITDVMQCIEQMGGAEELKQKAKRKKSVSKEKQQNDKNFDDEDPIEEVHILNDNLLKWQKDASKRMKNVSVTVTKLQSKLEDLDEYHAQAQQSAIFNKQKDNSEIERMMATINNLQDEVQKTKMELSQKNLVMQQLKKSTSEPSNHELIREKLDKLEAKEKELDRDAEIIATQSEELRKESERLLTERDEVRKQKEQWQKMIDEVKEQKAKLEKRESELQANHKKLLELHETLSEEKKKLHKKAKKIKAREKRLNALRNVPQPQYVQQTNQYQVPSSNGSDYAESELTYFSDGDTEIASVNSISDDESNDNYHKQQLKAIAHLGVPQNPMF